ncbi:5-formyltetrahydrofolate cyclo-ligase [Brachybacterium subflavum]|uniref:5-formyltetrahydrofolate cyclo-ligase n=1 Tax=Brachybacterium subflavum TaxID=2585206 RepID=UPI001D0D400E|nr:5-formyltetrahydrofolate cyclo-ligase [Brachybacterium subflavum]
MEENSRQSPAVRKRALRTGLRTERAATAHRSPDEDARLAGRADEVLALLPRATGPLRIAAFDPTPTEPDVRRLLRVLADRGHRILLPVHAGEGIDWAAWDGASPLAPPPARGFGGEPSGPREGADALARTDLVLAPALAVDRSGTRLGHGGGYYDRALDHARTAVVVAVVHPWEVLAPGALPCEAHDRPAHAVLTTGGVERLGS